MIDQGQEEPFARDGRRHHHGDARLVPPELEPEVEEPPADVDVPEPEFVEENSNVDIPETAEPRDPLDDQVPKKEIMKKE